MRAALESTLRPVGVNLTYPGGTGFFWSPILGGHDLLLMLGFGAAIFLLRALLDRVLFIPITHYFGNESLVFLFVFFLFDILFAKKSNLQAKFSCKVDREHVVLCVLSVHVCVRLVGVVKQYFFPVECGTVLDGFSKLWRLGLKTA